MPPIEPITLLLALGAMSLVAWTISRINNRSQQRELAALARAWHMHFSARDVFHLANRVAPHLPYPGAATVRVRDCIYGNEPGGHRYIFRAEFTLGATRSKHRHWRVASVLEPKSREEPVVWQSLKFAEEGLAMRDQYESLRTS